MSAAPWILSPAFEAMRPYAQWFVYRLYARDEHGKYRKHPIDPRTRQKPAKDEGGIKQCADFDTAARACAELQSKAPAGERYLLGFYLTENDPFAFFDIDGCVIQDQGKPAWSPLALELLAMFPRAARETSSSGGGLHVIAKTIGAPSKGRKNTEHNLELYTQDRGVALTFEGASGDAGADETQAFAAITAKYFPPKPSDKFEDWTTSGKGAYPDFAAAVEARTRESRTFAALIDGDIAGYPSASEADFAFFCELLRLNGGNCEGLFEYLNDTDLKLKRDKWDERWLRLTISNAYREVAPTLPANLFGKDNFTLPPGASLIKPVQAAPASPTIPAPPENRFKPISAWDHAKGDPPPWRIEGLLPQQGLAMFYGQSGAGKSFLLLDLTMAIARGVPFGYDNRKVNRGRVVYILAEGAWGFRSRVRAYQLHHKLTDADPAPLLVIVAPNFMLSADVDELRAAIDAAGGADVIVIDTLNATTPGANENAPDDMGRFLGHCRALQAATRGLVVIIHHSGKDEERGARGHSSLRAAVDTEVEVSGGGEKFSIAHVTKQRDGEDSVAVCYRLASVPDTGSAVVEHMPRPSKGASGQKKKISPEETLAVTVAQTLAGTYPDGIPRLLLATKIHEQRPDQRKDNIERTITRAINDGLLNIDSTDKVRVTAPTSAASTVRYAESFIRATAVAAAAHQAPVAPQVQAGQSAELTALAEVLDKLNRPAAVTCAALTSADLRLGWLVKAQYASKVPASLESVGYTIVQNPAREDGRWNGKHSRFTAYGRADLTEDERVAAAGALCG